MALGTALFAVAMIYFMIISSGFRKLVGGVLVLCAVGLFGLYHHSKDKPQTIFYDGSTYPAYYNRTAEKGGNVFDQFDEPQHRTAETGKPWQRYGDPSPCRDGYKPWHEWCVHHPGD